MATSTISETEIKDATKALLDRAEEAHTKPLWLQMARLNPPLPNPQCTPYLWKYSDIRPSLLQAGELVPEHQAERRVLMLVNPSRDAPFTTDTLYAGLQLVMPNETAKAHRHTAFAMRFIIEGEGGFTAVHGRRIKMQRGDVILTPTWNWHDHGKDGSGPMIWLDGLDLPNFQHFPVHFVEQYSSPRYPAEDVDTSSSPLVFPWVKMKAALDEKGEDWAELRYLKEDGSEVSKILGGSATRISAGTCSSTFQETASSVYHVIKGSGHTTVGKEKFLWEEGDTFCIPSWYRYQHFASEGEQPVYLYRFDDKPMLTSLGFYRTADMDVESLVSG
ncbi:Gentisate 1,2-dioxygenase [Cytospora mali]|uniref:Gentisate 1,2-dioxygenase n=1 Tax=Cytospora mali TaxID=578113 RepID=A0A194VK63_CYTMA|nr:Gentisate 1,2-dioxygenase [Valsa mali]